MRKIAIVLAGGRGSRMQSSVPKQYMQLLGKPVLYYSVNVFENSEVDEVILVAGRQDIEYCREQIVQRYGFGKVTQIVAGGSERCDSVLNGLRAVCAGDGEEVYVFIHDGARPCITEELVKSCGREVLLYKACVAGVPAKDTIKLADEEGFAAQTPDRSRVWQIQTPQCFEYGLVRKAYEAMAADCERGSITDDAMVVEKYTNVKVKLTMASYENIKITTPEDLLIAKEFLQRGEKR